MKIKSPAKLNLCLDIIKKTPSGLHEIQTIFQELPELHDTLILKTTQGRDHMSIAQAPQKNEANHLNNTNDNLVFRALLLLKKSLNLKKFAHIHIEKNIPLAAGLGGGSSNAAAVLKGLNQLWDLRLSKDDLADLGSQLGADVPFFIYGGTALGSVFGNKIKVLKPIRKIKFTLLAETSWPAAPFSSNKTQQMYQSLDLAKCAKNTKKTEALLQAIESENSSLILQNLHNDFETIIPTKTGEHLSGSGPALFKAMPL